MNRRAKTPGTTLVCSFCAKAQAHVKKLIAGPGVYICDECIELCVEIITLEVEEAVAAEATIGVPARELPVDVAIDRMVALHASRELVDRKVANAVRALRSRGVTWARIGEGLGISRQSAWERYSGEE